MQVSLHHTLNLVSHKSLVLFCFLPLNQNNFSPTTVVNLPHLQTCSLWSVALLQLKIEIGLSNFWNQMDVLSSFNDVKSWMEMGQNIKTSQLCCSWTQNLWCCLADWNVQLPWLLVDCIIFQASMYLALAYSKFNFLTLSLTQSASPLPLNIFTKWKHWHTVIKLVLNLHFDRPNR